MTYLQANLTNDGWSVTDTAGGTWWPNQEASEVIKSAADPAATAMMVCEHQPMRGEWRD